MGRRKTTDLGHLALDEEDVGFGPVLEASVAIAKQPSDGAADICRYAAHRPDRG